MGSSQLKAKASVLCGGGGGGAGGYGRRRDADGRQTWVGLYRDGGWVCCRRASGQAGESAGG